MGKAALFALVAAAPHNTFPGGGHRHDRLGWGPGWYAEIDGTPVMGPFAVKARVPVGAVRSAFDVRAHQEKNQTFPRVWPFQSLTRGEVKGEICPSTAKTLFINRPASRRGLGWRFALSGGRRDGANVAIRGQDGRSRIRSSPARSTARRRTSRRAGGKALAAALRQSATRSRFKTAGRQDRREIRRHRHLREQCGGAIQLTGTLQTDMKRYDLMNGVNAPRHLSSPRESASRI